MLDGGTRGIANRRIGRGQMGPRKIERFLADGMVAALQIQSQATSFVRVLLAGELVRRWRLFGDGWASVSDAVESRLSFSPTRNQIQSAVGTKSKIRAIQW